MNELAIVNSKAPFGSSSGKDALDIALIFASYEQGVSLFFQGDGVFQLKAEQDASLISIKDYLKTFAAFDFYDIEHIYVCDTSLSKRSMSNDFHIDGVEVLGCDAFAAKLNEHKTILRF